MGPTPWTSPGRCIGALLIVSAVVLSLLLSAAAQTQAASVATVAAQLAVDTDRLAATRGRLDRVTSELANLRSERDALRRNVRVRLVAIYKYGGERRSLLRVVGGESMVDLARALDALDHVADHDARLVRRWRTVEVRMDELAADRARLVVRRRALEVAVRSGRERLSRAEARLGQARREAARMARVRESALLPKVGHPENVVIEGAGRDLTPAPIGFVETGVASMYHDSFSGERTANGETYDPAAFTAAHPTLPFGTWATVHGPTGAVAVRINDRGPFVGGRIIDLSRAAAEAIGLPGVATVTLNVAA